MKDSLPLIVPIDNRIDLLPFHAAYYHRLGFQTFVYALWNGRENPIYERILPCTRLAGIPDSDVFIETSVVCDYDHYNGPAETPGLNDIRMKYAKHDEWYCVADLDEFYWFDGMDLDRATSVLDANGYLAMHGHFVDRVACDGSFPEIPPFTGSRPQLDDLFPCTADLSKVTGCGDNKISLARLTGIRSGHHYATLPPDKVASNAMQVHHFKWHSGVLDLLKRRHKSYSSQYLKWAYESRQFYDFFQKPGWIKEPILNTRAAQRIGI